MQEKKPAMINVGGASLMMLFAVLCLTVFAVLSLVSARAQNSLAQKSADAIQNYYRADYEACQVYESIRDGAVPDFVDVNDGMNETYYSYEVEIDDSQALSVILVESPDGFDVLTWKVYYSADWDIDTDINVWTGN